MRRCRRGVVGYGCGRAVHVAMRPRWKATLPCATNSPATADQAFIVDLNGHTAGHRYTGSHTVPRCLGTPGAAGPAASHRNNARRRNGDHLGAERRISLCIIAAYSENSLCSILFHLLVPGGRWQTVMVSPSSLARACSSRFHNGTRAPLLPPQSAVITRLCAVG